MKKAGIFINKDMIKDKSKKVKYRPWASLYEIFPEGKGRDERFILSISISQISFIILPDANVNDAANAAKITEEEKTKLG